MTYYRLGKYVYKNLGVYRTYFFGLIKVRVDDRCYPLRGGVRRVNELNGHKVYVADTSHLTKVKVDDEFVPGRYLVNFPNHDVYDFHTNDPMPATIHRYGKEDRLEVIWDNGHQCVDKPEALNIWILKKEERIDL